ESVLTADRLERRRACGLRLSARLITSARLSCRTANGSAYSMEAVDALRSRRRRKHRPNPPHPGRQNLRLWVSPHACGFVPRRRIEVKAGEYAIRQQAISVSATR